jgi:hypothetical protein
MLCEQLVRICSVNLVHMLESFEDSPQLMQYMVTSGVAYFTSLPHTLEAATLDLDHVHRLSNGPFF